MPSLLPALASSLLHRLTQGLAALRPRVPADRDVILAATLTPAQAAAFRRLPTHDQAHLCAVYRALHAARPDDADLHTAGLLHDLGKVDPAGRGRVRLPDRAARVLLARFAPALLTRLARLPAPPWRRGLALAVHHPHLGAAWAATLGASPRACWLIAHHHDPFPPPDPALHLLITTDRSTP